MPSRPSPALISASRRTDVPRFFADWFRARRRAGFAEYENVFRFRGRVSLEPADVLGYLFWTRDARPLESELARLRGEGVPYAFQFTITGYGPEIESNRLPLGQAVESFLRVAADLPGPQAIEWRYDPIVLSSAYPPAFHIETFQRLAEELGGHTRVVNGSLVEPYRKAVERLADPSVLYRTPDPERHRAVCRRHPALRFAHREGPLLARRLADLGRQNGIELRACANPELGLPPSRCCGTELFEPYGPDVLGRLRVLRPTPTRPGCRCLQAVDIGMNETCRGGCRYCYVTSSDRAFDGQSGQYDPDAASLRSLRLSRT
jgi:hypothetical protein